MNFLGKHLFIELYGCEADRLSDPQFIKRIIKEAGSITLDENNIRQIADVWEGVIFADKGFYGFHSFPKERYIGIDYFSYDENIDSQKILSFLVRKFGAEKYSASEQRRGVKEV